MESAPTSDARQMLVVLIQTHSSQKDLSSFDTNGFPTPYANASPAGTAHFGRHDLEAGETPDVRFRRRPLTKIQEWQKLKPKPDDSDRRRGGL
jgi:hypothetical protein